MGRLRSVMAVLPMLLLLVVAGCGPAATARETSSVSVPPTALHVVRAPGIPQDHIPPFARSVTTVTSVQRLYQAMYALPRIPKLLPGEAIACPADYGLEYYLTFLAGSKVIERADMYASGCVGIAVSATDVRRPNDAFWALFAQTLGITQDELFPRPS